MSLENEDGLDKSPETFDDVSMKPRISYSRELLLSLGNLDICKKLPSGFDESLMSEFEDALVRIPDRPRVPGTFPSQGFRRTEYSSSPPTRGDSSNYSRGIYGKWESRSSGRSDRDSDSQSERDSDSGRRFGNQSRRSWQSPEHDGLLGSGSFPRPSGFAAGVSAPKVRASEHNQLSRTTEPYQPPRPYKAVPHLRKDTDAVNDETFGSLECTSEDRAEEERRRRASFEMMRKEQHKALQENQKSNLEKHKTGGLSGLCEGLVDDKEEKRIVKNNQFAGSAAIPILSSDLEKSSSASHSPASRPLIPPGFKTNSLEKSSVLKSLIHPSSEVGKPLRGENLVNTEANLLRNTNNGSERRLSQEISVVNGQPAEKTEHAIAEFNANVLEEKTVGDSNRGSLLEKIFGNTSSVNDGHSSSPEHHDSKLDDSWSPKAVQSSKFAQWFFEEEAMAAADVSSAKPNNLLSLIVSGDKANVAPEQASINNKEDAAPAVLTCEDLEQSILSKYSTKITNIQPARGNWSTNGPKTEHVDNHASLNLLTMLQKGTDQSNPVVNSGIISQEHDTATVVNEPEGDGVNGKTVPDLGKTATLEALFGTAFMKELQSVQAPVSVQREPHPVMENGISSPTIEKNGLQRSSHDYNVSSNNHRQNHGFDDSPLEIASSKLLQLPEEDNLMSAFMPSGNNSINNANLHSNIPINITEKLAAFGVVKDERVMERDSYPPQMPQLRQPLYHHMNSQQPIFNHDSPANHNLQFPPNMMRPPFLNNHHPNVRVAGFDVPPQNPMLHQMQMQGNHPPHFPPGVPGPHHGSPGNSFMEMNHMQGGFPFGGPRQPVNRGPMPGNTPEAFQRLIEMELRSKSKQIQQPFAPGQNQGTYGHEVNLGFRYR